MLSSFLIPLVRNELRIYLLKTILTFSAFKEPVTLIGEGEYNLNVLKEIKATDSYLGLDQDVRKCQNDEPLSNCTTKKYIEAILSQCKCLPSNLRLSNEVRKIKMFDSLRETMFNTNILGASASMFCPKIEVRKHHSC